VTGITSTLSVSYMVTTYILVALGSAIFTGVLVYLFGSKKTPKKTSRGGTESTAELIPWSRVNEFIEHDRQRISSDLHDELGTVLSLIHLDLELVMREADALPPHIEAKLITVKKNLNLTIETIRNIIWNLSPDFIEGMSLNFAIRELCHKLDAMKGTHVHFVQSGTPVPIQQRQKLSLFRMVQELFSNAIKHSNAWNISVHIHWDKENLTITVEDDGSDYRRQEHEQKTSGMGMINLLKRANSIGATLRREDVSPRGLRVIIEFNLQQQKDTTSNKFPTMPTAADVLS
jgi:signal transduction histidine kinase